MTIPPLWRLTLRMLPVGLLWISISNTTLLAAEPFPQVLSFSGQSLSVQGVGTRKKAFIGLYDAGLYLSGETSDNAADTIVAADQPMAIRLTITSGFISSSKMLKALGEGFEKSTAGDTGPITSEISAFAATFSDPIEKQDQFDLIYLPGRGVEVIKNGETKGLIAGMAFKVALFGIWLGQDPVQGSLKSDLLGQ